MKVVICDYKNVLEKNYEPTIRSMNQAYGTSVKCEIHPYTDETALVELLQEADGLITGFLEIPEKILKKCSQLKCISVSGAGYSNIDVKAAGKYGVTVCHIREYCTEEVAEHTFSLIGALNRNLKFYTERVERNYEWNYQAIPGGKNLSSQTIAVFGFGRIGRRVAAIASAYGMKVLVVDPFAAGCRENVEYAKKLGAAFVSAEEAFGSSDIITNHMNLTADNRHFFGREAFDQMKKSGKTPMFINVGRGGSVDEKALIRALDSGSIRAAGLDVLESEEPDLKKCGLLHRENVILTPHSAFYSEESIKKLQEISGANMGYVLAGRPEAADETVVRK